jgi:hypothetical protein
MVSDMSDWKWSSYTAMAYDVSATAWLEKDWILSHLGKSWPSAILNYKDFVREGIVSAYRSRDYTMKLIADKFKVHYSTVSRAINKTEMHDCKT